MSLNLAQGDYTFVCLTTSQRTIITVNMKTKIPSLIILAVLCLPLLTFGQFSLELRPVNWTGAPGVHSFAHGHHNGKWLIIGGRVDGLHMRRPFEAFLATDNNTDIFVVDPSNQQSWSMPLSSLSTALQEQLQSTNMEFEQRGDMLYIVGGYGYSATAGDHITYGNLTAVDVPATIDAIVNGQPIAPHFRQISDNRLKVTGGYLDQQDSVFYLVGGQNFEGRYNPMGPTHGPGFFQEYTDEIRKFEIQDNGTTLSIVNYSATHDSANLHRRDYNMLPQIFPNGTRGFTAFSGVFQHAVDLPWLNTVDIDPNGYTVNNNFNQYLSQYHSASLPVYDSVANEMHTVFFGGMSQFTLDPGSGTLVEDQDVPFVKTISRVSRYPNGSMDEFKMPVDMPDYLGAGAEFLPLAAAPYDEQEILHMNQLPMSNTLVGHILGGIKSTAENIFFVNDGTQSSANTTLFEVWINTAPVGVEEDLRVQSDPIDLRIYPNPGSGTLQIELSSIVKGKVKVTAMDIQGREVVVLLKDRVKPGVQTLPWDTSGLDAGLYFVRAEAGSYNLTRKVVVR